MSVNTGFRRGIEISLRAIPREATEQFLRNVCTTHFKPEAALELPLETLEMFIDKCTPGAIDFLMEKLREGKFDAGIARVQAIINKDPNRK